MFKLMFKTLVFAFTFVFCVLNVGFAPISAMEEVNVPVSFEYGTSRSVGYGKLVDDTTYFHIRSFSVENGAVEVKWDEKTATAYVVCPGLTVSATVGSPYIIANGRVIYAQRENFIENGRLYVPARSICKAFGCRTTFACCYS